MSHFSSLQSLLLTPTCRRSGFMSRAFIPPKISPFWSPSPPFLNIHTWSPKFAAISPRSGSTRLICPCMLSPMQGSLSVAAGQPMWCLNNIWRAIRQVKPGPRSPNQRSKTCVPRVPSQNILPTIGRPRRPAPVPCVLLRSTSRTSSLSLFPTSASRPSAVNS